MANPDVQSLFDLSGKVALISGASGYLGSAMSSALAEAGATVIVTSRDADRAAAAAAALPQPGNASHHALVMDQHDPQSIEMRVCEQNAAATSGGGVRAGRLVETKLEPGPDIGDTCPNIVAFLKLNLAQGRVGSGQVFFGGGPPLPPAISGSLPDM